MKYLLILYLLGDGYVSAGTYNSIEECSQIGLEVVGQTAIIEGQEIQITGFSCTKCNKDLR